MASSPLVFFVVISTLSSASLVSSSPQCPREYAPFLCSLQSQCPVSIFPNPPLEVDGDFLDRFLESKDLRGYTSILLHASWCPFSSAVVPTFEALSSMFPQINHLAVDHSSTFPSVLSRYHIHSFPVILLVNQTSRMQYYGPKTLRSLMQFYDRNTGCEPVQYVMPARQMKLQARESSIMLLTRESVKETWTKDPFLVCSVLFLCVRILVMVLPQVVSHLRALWFSYAPNLSLEVFGGITQILGRLLPTVDVRRVWMKLKMCKARRFHERVRSVRVWASSLTSVSLGQSSSARSSS